MAKNWTEDAMLVDSITGNLFEALPLLPKRLVRVDAVGQEHDHWRDQQEPGHGQAQYHPSAGQPG